MRKWCRLASQEMYILTLQSLRRVRRAKKVDLALESFADMKAKDVRPDAVTYNNLIVACTRGQSVACAFELFDEMKTVFNIEPDAVTYTSLISSCSRDLKEGLGRAESLFDELKSRNLQPNRATYNSMISVCV